MGGAQALTVKIASWNVQWCRGVDGRVDMQRVIRAARRFADFDLLLLQEVAANFPAPRLADCDGEDQFAGLAALLEGFVAIDAPGTDVADGAGPARRRFGNLLLSRYPVRQAIRHALPMPFDAAAARTQRRSAIEAIVCAPGRDLRVITCHLEPNSALQRGAQVERLREIYAEGYRHASAERILDAGGGPFHTIVPPPCAVIAGDFNFEPGHPEYERLTAPLGEGTPRLVDAWSIACPGKPHPYTFRLHDRARAVDTALHGDYVFVSRNLSSSVVRVKVDLECRASDHQPVLLELNQHPPSKPKP